VILLKRWLEPSIFDWRIGSEVRGRRGDEDKKESSTKTSIGPHFSTSLTICIGSKGLLMGRLVFTSFSVGAAACVLASVSITARPIDNGASPIFGVRIPAGYRQWELVAPAHEAGSLDELRAVLGNALSINAYRDGALPFPDGAFLAKLAWKHVPVAGVGGAFVTGPATTVQIMMKDSKKYA
jgi:hypothetical protein